MEHGSQPSPDGHHPVNELSSKEQWRELLQARRLQREHALDMRPQVEALIAQLRPATVASYAPLVAEPSPGIQADYYPRLFDNESVDNESVLPPGSWGRPPLVTVRRGWPPQPLTTVEPPPLDLILVPALAVDLSGTRLGKGGGWYDRALTRLSGLVFAVVHSDEVFPAGTLPAFEHDIRVDGFVTEDGFQFCESSIHKGERA